MESVNRGDACSNFILCSRLSLMGILFAFLEFGLDGSSVWIGVLFGYDCLEFCLDMLFWNFAFLDVFYLVVETEPCFINLHLVCLGSL